MKYRNKQFTMMATVYKHVKQNKLNEVCIILFTNYVPIK